MRLWNALFAALVALWVFAPFSLLAQGKGPPEGRPRSQGAPGPIVGVGLPFLVLAGAYWLVRRRESRANDK
jgi:hypothetical protein